MTEPSCFLPFFFLFFFPFIIFRKICLLRCEDNVIFMIINLCFLLFSFSHCLAITGADFTMRNPYIYFQHLFLLWCSPTCTLHYSNLNSVCVYIILFTWIFSFVFFSFTLLTGKEILFVALNSTSFFCRVPMHYWELESYLLFFFLLFVFTIFVKFAALMGGFLANVCFKLYYIYQEICPQYSTFLSLFLKFFLIPFRLEIHVRDNSEILFRWGLCVDICFNSLM